MESYINNIIDKANKFIPNWYASNENYDPLPMLAYRIEKVKEINYPLLAQPKLNGVRMLVKENTINIILKMISRGGTYYIIPHLQTQLSSLFTKIRNTIKDVNLLLDGEIYVHGIPLQEISGAARKEESGLFTSNSWLEYHIYDVIDLNDIKTSQTQRNINLYALALLNDQPNIKIVHTSEVKNLEEVESLHNKFVSEGYEGLILRDPHGEYKFNQRTRNLLKVKKYQDEEFKIIGCEIDDNKTIGESFVFILKNNINDLTFKSRPTGTDAQKEYWLDNPDTWQLQMATVRFFERSKDGLPQQGSVQSKLTEVLHIRAYGE